MNCNLLLNLPHDDLWLCAYMPVNVPGKEDFETDTIPESGENCETNTCQEVLEGFRNRGSRIIHDRFHFVIPFSEWHKLCSSCKKIVYIWYYQNLVQVKPEDKLP